MENKLKALLTKIEIHSPLTEDLICCKCQELLLDPKQTKCGHLFCSSCLSLLFMTGKATCPIDNKNIERDEIFKDAVVKQHVFQLQVLCPNKEQGCSEICCLRNLVEHVEKCSWQRITCPQGCQKSILSRELVQHLQTECSERHVLCEYCDSDVVYSKLEDHLSDCLLLPVSCPFQCNIAPLTREKMNIHIKSCPQKPFICKFSRLGCMFQGSQEMITEHELDSSYHLNLLLIATINQSAYVNATIAQVNSEIKELQNENHILKNQLEITRKFHQHTIIHLEQLNKKLIQLQLLSIDSGRLSDGVNLVADGTNTESFLKEEFERLEESILNLEQKVKLNSMASGNLQKSFLQHENQLTHQNMNLTDLNVKLQKLEMTSYNGRFIWKINEFTRRRQESMINKTASIYSTPFYTEQYGYKMCVQMSCNKNLFMSIYLVLMKSKMDAILNWPFQPKVTFMLLDQKKGTDHIVKTEATNIFSKPTKEMNSSLGFSDFVPLRTIEKSDRYLINDTIFIKVIVEPHKEINN